MPCENCSWRYLCVRLMNPRANDGAFAFPESSSSFVRRIAQCSSRSLNQLASRTVNFVRTSKEKLGLGQNATLSHDIWLVAKCNHRGYVLNRSQPV